jgi:ParB family transcriptional regulator, chromosome partitioning protein
MSYFQGDSIFWIEVEKIKTNPFQPRKEFDEEKLRSLADSVRQYGVLQPLVVTRREIEKEDGGIATEYELIAGERRLRASKIAQLTQVPVIIKSGEEDSLMKLELAIIENVQREDLNPIDRAIAFNRLVGEFGFKHGQVAKKIGKSREYVSNTLRLLTLPEEIKEAVSNQKISEGHARTLMMLSDRPEEQATLFKEVIYKHLTVRETETIARRIAHDKVRKKEYAYNPELAELEGRLSESLGTRVQIESRENGGKITIDFFSPEDVRNILALITATSSSGEREKYDMLNKFIDSQSQQQQEERLEIKTPENNVPNDAPEESNTNNPSYVSEHTRENPGADVPVYGRVETNQEAESSSHKEENSLEKEDESESDNNDELYSVKNFSI